MRFSVSTFTRRITSFLATAAAVVTGACAADEESTSTLTTLTLVASDSFVLPADAFADFTAATGITVEIAVGGDAGEVVSKAVLTAGNPEGDVLWGVDTTLLSRAIDGDVFDPYVAAEPAIPQRLRAAGVNVVTPVDVGHVCINYDI
ncbi:MAG: thiamine ABC transporter substrate-binding protein, partial [Actinomycetota bacterium]